MKQIITLILLAILCLHTVHASRMLQQFVCKTVGQPAQDECPLGPGQCAGGPPAQRRLQQREICQVITIVASGNNSCIATKFCPYGTVCKDSFCLTIQCLDNSQCFPDSQGDRICVNSFCERKPCVLASNCNPGQKCQNGFCSIPKCKYNSDCDRLERCNPLSGTCTPFIISISYQPPLLPICQIHEQCPSGQYCQGGRCLSRQCNTDLNCAGRPYTCDPTTKICTAGAASVPGIPIDFRGGCSDVIPCTIPNTICQNGVCAVKGCVSNEDCEGYGVTCANYDGLRLCQNVGF